MSINAVLVTAARVRFGLNVKGLGLGGGPRRRALDETTSVVKLVVTGREAS